MLLKSLSVSKSDFELGTGWSIKPEGACKGDICIPLPESSIDADSGMLNVNEVASAMNLPLAHEPQAKLWAMGPDSIGGRALSSAKAPELQLPDIDGNEFKLSSLKGKKVLVYAWAPY